MDEFSYLFKLHKNIVVLGDNDKYAFLAALTDIHVSADEQSSKDSVFGNENSSSIPRGWQLIFPAHAHEEEYISQASKIIIVSGFPFNKGNIKEKAVDLSSDCLTEVILFEENRHFGATDMTADPAANKKEIIDYLNGNGVRCYEVKSTEIDRRQIFNDISIDPEHMLQKFKGEIVDARSRFECNYSKQYDSEMKDYIEEFELYNPELAANEKKLFSYVPQSMKDTHGIWDEFNKRYRAKNEENIHEELIVLANHFLGYCYSESELDSEIRKWTEEVMEEYLVPFPKNMKCKSVNDQLEFTLLNGELSIIPQFKQRVSGIVAKELKDKVKTYIDEKLKQLEKFID